MSSNEQSRTDKIVPPTRSNMAAAAEIIRSGGLVAFPTETVYGLGANALSADAVKKIFEAKGRPGNNPLIVHVAGISDASRYAEISNSAEILMHQFWPGPLSLVLSSFSSIPPETRANLDTVAMRAPLNPIALELISLASVPIAAPSANRSGRPSPTEARDVWDDLGDAVDMIIDGGHTTIGLESTVVDATGEALRILRPGGVTREALARFVDIADDDESENFRHRSPGNMYRHYAPLIPVMLWDVGQDGDAVFANITNTKWSYMGMSDPPGGISEPCKKIIADSLADYARRLYSAMRELEASGAEVIVAEFPSDVGLGSAVRDRLRRASEDK